ncbi:hypothetical protein MNBD_GAMMA08-2089 [hydrothermal vent metagenome]|uniref:Uncharacterized protein n=1 Tax=hydrothermal vent metagenome TaxID=652676 RepID=A0A3B0XZY5_9ZZZZ
MNNKTTNTKDFIDDSQPFSDQQSSIHYKSEYSKIKKMGRLTFKFASFSVLISVAIVLSLVVLATIPLSSLQLVNEKIITLSAWLSIVRLIFILALAIYWLEVNTWLSKRKQWSDAYLKNVLNGRWIAISGLLFIELVFIQRIHQPLIDWLLI